MAVTAVIASAVSVTVLAPRASATELWAAFAYSPTTGVIGTAVNHPSYQDAAHRAVQECQSHDPQHPTDCAWLGSFGHCGALAISLTDLGVYAFSGGVSGTLEDHERDAVSKVPGGAVAWRICNGDDQGPGGASGVWQVG